MDVEIPPSGEGPFHLSSTRVSWAAILSLVVAAAAQQTLDQRTSKSVALLMYGAAAIAFGVLLRHTAIESRASQASAAGRTHPSPAVLGVTLGLSLLGCLDFGDNEFRPLGLVFWVGGLILSLSYLWMLSPAGARDRHPKRWWRRYTLSIPAHWFVLASILCVGAWFRFRLLNEIPADLGPDLIHHYYDTLDILEGKYRIYFPERESLIFYCTALCTRVVGLTQLSLHLTSALIGMATIVALYLLGQEAFNRQVALMAALLMAINRWHIALSRSAYPAVFTPLVVVLVLYALIRAIRQLRFIDFAWAGIVLGLGLYTFTPFKAMPFVVVVGLALYVSAKRWAELRSLLPGLLVMTLVALVVFAPLARFAIERPKEYFARELVALRLKSEQTEPDPGLATYYWRSVLAFNYAGDGTSRWNVPGARHMGAVSGMLMILGIGYALWRWRQGYNALLLCAWFMLILPAALGMLPRDTPSSLRMSGTLGPAVLLAALPLPVIGQQIQLAMSRRQRSGDPLPSNEHAAEDRGLAISLTVKSTKKHYAWKWQPCLGHALQLILCLAAVVLLAYETQEANRFYFRDFVARAPTRANYSHPREIARQIEHYGDLESTYIKVWPYWFNGTAVRVSLRLEDRTWNCEVPTLAPDQPPLSTIQGTALFIVHPDDQEAMDTLRSFFPSGLTIPRNYPDGTLSFYTFYGER